MQTLGRFDLRISVCMCSKVDNFTYVYHFYLCVLRDNDVCRTQCAMKLLFVDNMYHLIMMCGINAKWIMDLVVHI